MPNTEEYKISAGNADTFFVADSGNIFGIAFDKLFEFEDLSVYNDFDMTSKRNFKNLSPLILETYEELFLDEGGRFNDELSLILFKMLDAKSRITVNDSTSYDDFIKFVDNITDSGDGLLIKRIDSFVEENYALDLDAITEATKEKKKKVNEELQFSDDHAKVLLKISYLYRVMIPIISVYFAHNKSNFNNIKTNDELEGGDIEELKFEEVNSLVFSYLFEKFADNPTALRNKLYRLTSSRIIKTSYSDKRFWTAAKNVAITKDTETLEIYKKLLTNALPKLSIDGDKNIISFLQSVINNQIDFLFQNKFKYRFTTLGSTAEHYGTEDDEDDVSEFERIEIQTTRKNEGSYIIRKLNIADVLETIPEKFGVGVSDAEVKALLSKVNRNSIQEQIISMMTFKYFEDKNAMKFMDIYQYCYLLIACKKFLEAHKFIYLPVLLTANCQKHKDRINICGKKVRPEIMNSKKYRSLFDSKYKSFAEDMDGPFLSFIGTTYSSIFVDDEGNEIFDASVKVAKIAEELLDVASLI